MIDRYADKDPLEELTLSMDVSPLLDAGETVQSAQWLITREDLPTEDTTAMVSGAIDIGTPGIIKQKVIGGTVGGAYIHRAKFVTSAGRTLVMGARQYVTFGA